MAAGYSSADRNDVLHGGMIFFRVKNYNYVISKMPESHLWKEERTPLSVWIVKHLIFVRGEYKRFWRAWFIPVPPGRSHFKLCFCFAKFDPMMEFPDSNNATTGNLLEKRATNNEQSINPSRDVFRKQMTRILHLHGNFIPMISYRLPGLLTIKGRKLHG